MGELWTTKSVWFRADRPHLWLRRPPGNGSERAERAGRPRGDPGQGAEAGDPARVLPPVPPFLPRRLRRGVRRCHPAFLWPNLKGGFGSAIDAGKLTDIKAQIQSTNQPVYFGAGRFYIVPFTGKPSGNVNYEAEGVATQGIMSLYQRCPHLGCRVPFCQQSQWFECPCHGSKYNFAGEYQLGPAPRGMDRFKVTVTASGEVMVDTSQIILGPPRGTNTIHEPPQGPFCVAPG